MSVDGRAVEAATASPTRSMCSAWWMFSMLTSRMKSGWDSWWSNVSSARRADRRGRVEVLDVDAAARRCGCCRRRAPARRRRAPPCRRSSSRSSAWWCASGRRSRPRARRRSRWSANSRVATSRISARVRSASRVAGPDAAASRACRADMAGSPVCARGSSGMNVLVRTLHGKPNMPLDDRHRRSASAIHWSASSAPASAPSLSPALHEREAAALGLRYVYRAPRPRRRSGSSRRTSAMLLGEAQLAGFAGLNVTHPCKQAGRRAPRRALPRRRTRSAR